jgi:hypothetical protein
MAGAKKAKKKGARVKKVRMESSVEAALKISNQKRPPAMSRKSAMTM